MKLDYRWRYKSVDEELVKQISLENHLPPILSRILTNRGYQNQQEIKRFLYPSKEDFHHPFSMKDLEKSANRILKARDGGELITVYGDYDVDGITSTSCLYLFLQSIGCHVDFYIPDRLQEGYGVNTDALKKLKKQGTALIITVDTGITACACVEDGKAMGLEIIITDHHECQADIPNAFGVINPKQKDCTYPFKALAGVGVTFKLIHGIALIIGSEDIIWKYLDIVAIGTIADIVPLQDENRLITQLAFATIPNTWNLGLRKLLEVTGAVGKKMTSSMIGFQLGPRLNAAGRLGDAKRGVELFITEDEDRAFQLATALNEENIRRQQIEQGILQEANRFAEATLRSKERKVLVLAGEGWAHGVIGIVASRIVERFYRPTILLTVEDGIASGSCRSVEGFSIFDALTSCKELFLKFGGHEMAAGCSLDANNIPLLIDALEEYANQHMEEETLIRKLDYDSVLSVEEITTELIEQIGLLEPYGAGNEEPRFIVQGTAVSYNTLGRDKNHLKVYLKEHGKTVEGIGFSLAETADILYPEANIQVLCGLSINEWQDRRSPQMMIKDIQWGDELRLEIHDIIQAIKDYELKSNKVEPCYYPEQEDYRKVYRYLMGLENKGISSVCYLKLEEDFQLKSRKELTSIFICLQVFQELSLIRVFYYKHRLDFQIIKGKKVELTESKLYNKCIE